VTNNVTQVLEFYHGPLGKNPGPLQCAPEGLVAELLTTLLRKGVALGFLGW